MSFTRLNRYKPYRNPYIRITVLLLTFVAIILFVNTIIVRLFMIRDVKVIGSNMNLIINPDKIGNNLLFFPAGRYEQQIIEDYPQIKSVEIRKKYPGTIIIDITVRDPVAIVHLGNISYLVDTAGYVVGQKERQDQAYPEIYIDKAGITANLQLNNVDLRAALRLFSLIRSGLTIDSLTVTDGKSILAKSGKTNIIFPREYDENNMAATLQSLFLGFRMKGTMPTNIDLRFSKPVVTF